MKSNNEKSTNTQNKHTNTQKCLYARFIHMHTYPLTHVCLKSVCEYTNWLLQFSRIPTECYRNVDQSYLPYIQILLKEDIEHRVWEDIHLH